MTTMNLPSAVSTVSRTTTIGGDLTVNRLGYGAMHLTGPGMWGPPTDPDNAVRLLRRAVELGVNFIDTADSYGPGDNERIIREALAPYPDDVVLTTKGGMLRSGPNDWTSPPPYVQPLGRPAYLRQQVELSLRNLGVERIDLYQLHSIDPLVPLADQLGLLMDMRSEGKIRHIGISGQPEVPVDVIDQALSICPELAAVENLYNVADRTGEAALRHVERLGLKFLPWFPLGHGELVGPDSPLRQLAAECGVNPSQLALAWLLHTSPATVAIPGTTSVNHLEENVAASEIVLTEADQAAILEAVEQSGIRPWRPAQEKAKAVTLEGAHPNVLLLRRLYSDLATIADHCSPDVVLHPAAARAVQPDIPLIRGAAAVADWERNFVAAFAGTLAMDVDSITANDYFGAVTGTIRGELDSNALEMPFCGLWRFRDGLLVEHWENAYDPFALAG
jgi:pyridoxine 4-dehydrogenase